MVGYDYEGDGKLFRKAVGNDMPEWLHGQNIYRHINHVALQMFFIENRIKDHHALNDAKANRHAYDANKANTNVMRFKKSR